jgi:hypothetical protein
MLDAVMCWAVIQRVGDVLIVWYTVRNSFHPVYHIINIEVLCVGCLYIMDPIKAWKMEHIKTNYTR